MEQTDQGKRHVNQHEQQTDPSPPKRRKTHAREEDTNIIPDHAGEESSDDPISPQKTQKSSTIVSTVRDEAPLELDNNLLN